MTTVAPTSSRVEWPSWTRFAIEKTDLATSIARLGSDRRVERWLASLRHRITTGTSFPDLDQAKRWDEANVVELLSYAGPQPRGLSVLDCGAYNSPAPWAAAELGIETVAAIDLNPRLPMSPKASKISYSCQNMMATAFHAATFDVIVAGSVVEHGVDWDVWLSECRRIIRPGGLLYVSTDVVHESVELDGLTAFGLPWTPLNPCDINEMPDRFAAAGFDLEPVTAPPLPAHLPFEFLGVEIGFVAFAATASGGVR